MALWQYDLFLIPKEKISLIKGMTESEDNNLYSFDDSFFWKDKEMLISEFDIFKSFLGIGKSWHKDLVVYGDLEENCVKIFLRGESVLSVTVRIDFRDNYNIFLKKLIEFCKQYNLIILAENMHILPHDEGIISKLIEGSAQVQKYNSLSE